MNLLRTDQQVAFNDLLIACRKSADHYRDAMDIIDSPAAKAALQPIAQERTEFVERLDRAVRALEDLPSGPDPDKESLEKIYHRLRAALSGNDEREVLEQRLAAEQQLSELVDAAREADPDARHHALLGDLEAHIETVSARLRALEQRTE